MTGKIITISRQFGSGGRSIGRMAAEELGIRCIDSEIIAETAKEVGFTEEYVKEQSEQTEESGFFAALNYYGSINRDMIWRRQCEVIRRYASEGPCVIVGRCADYVLRGEYDLLRVFIHADEEYRADRIVNVYGEREDKPLKRLADKDKRRAAYYEIYTDQRFGDPANYDICLNSGTIGIEECVRIITDLYRSK